MKNDFFTYSRQKIEKDKAAGRCDVANNRGAALKCLSKFLGKEEVLKIGKEQYGIDLLKKTGAKQ